MCVECSCGLLLAEVRHGRVCCVPVMAEHTEGESVGFSVNNRFDYNPCLLIYLDHKFS